ncbi:MAG: MetQ/NlpA family ABC transporter substrate-binding protein [Syntrophomonadaceae bacterium]|nr:MetQ/NlpA family ABC transporter substrate-binding protein [Syntrophomonadaceae bacterium]MDD3890007.1 MetQ/NlpA family ABC transporter substrate-binding protein [Syntrophomonadaceae bacterium]MDD4550083.1 MetQ/NlpA family ABC transporter substrate-binding protein [Syntrophomonadaceae bacterium]
MKKVLICLIIIFSSIIIFAGCTQEKDDYVMENTINIGVMPDVESIPLIIAEKNGYFEKKGVKVNIEHFKSAKDRDSALQSGILDGVITDMLAVVFANEGGFNLRIIAKNDGNIELLAGKDSGIDSISDLKGKTLGLSTNTIMEYSTDKMLAAHQLSPEDVRKIAIPELPTRLEMLQSGKIDAAILPEPLASLAVKNGAKVLTSTDQLANKAGAIAFTSKSLQEQPEAIKAVFRAYNDGVDYLQEEPVSSYIDFLIEEQGFPLTIKDSIKLPQYTKAELPDEKVFADVVQWMKVKNFIKEEYKYKDLIDDQVLR